MHLEGLAASEAAHGPVSPALIQQHGLCLGAAEALCICRSHVGLHEARRNTLRHQAAVWPAPPQTVKAARRQQAQRAQQRDQDHR